MGAIKLVHALHGWTHSTQKWQPVLKELKQAGIRPVLLKIPGLTTNISQAWTLPDYVQWLKKQVAGKPTVLLGHSNGGRIALAFATAYPEFTSKLILIDSAGISRLDIKTRIKRGIFGSLAKAGKQVTHSDYLRRLLYKLSRESDYYHAQPHLRRTMKNLIAADNTLNLSHVRTPTLIIWGEKDKVTPISDGKLMRQKIPNSQLQVIKNARHSPQFSHPQAVAQLVTSFVNSS